MRRSKTITRKNPPETRDWSGLPEPPLVSVLTHLDSLPDFCSFRRVCAAWRSVAKAGTAEFMASLPPLLFHPSEYRLYSVTDKRFYRRDPPRAAAWALEEDILGFSHGYAIYSDRRLPSPRLAIVHPAVGFDHGGAFPAWPRGFARGAHLTAPPTSPDCVLLANDRRRLLYSRAGDREWTAHDWPIGDSIVSMAAYNGKAYCLTQRRTLFVVEFLPAGVNVTLQKAKGLPFEGYVCLAGYGDELLAFPHRSDLGDGIGRFGIYRLSSGEGRWVEAEGMGGRALFVGDCKWAVVEDPRRWGWKGDCAYFVGSERRPRRRPREALLFWSESVLRGFDYLSASMASVYHVKDKKIELLDARLPPGTWLEGAWLLTNPWS